jgi:hypothetical protein
MDLFVTLYWASVNLSEILHGPSVNDGVFSAVSAFITMVLAVWTDGGACEITSSNVSSSIDSLRSHFSLECFVHDSRSRLIEHTRDDESDHAHSGRVYH